MEWRRGPSLPRCPRPWLLLPVGIVLALSGCAGGPKRVHVSGRITYDGKPVPAGEIYFDPDFTKGYDGPQGFARIRNGQYDTRQGGVPAAAGPHVVRILGFDGQGRPDEELPLGRRLFADYKAPAELPPGDNASLDFQVSLKGPPR